MPNKDLTISIPEPLNNGKCSTQCPLYHDYEWDSECSMKLSALTEDKQNLIIKGLIMVPGKNCPQYQDTN